MLLSDIHADPHLFHAGLAKYNSSRVIPSMPSSNWEEDERSTLEYRILEGNYLESLRATVKPLKPEDLSDTDEFVSWFESLAESGPGQQHPLFDWLETEATLEQMKWFLTQEAAGEAGFEDLIAYTQVKLPSQAKLECARNFWDEMGRGKGGAMHGPLLERMVKELDLRPSIDLTVWESLALANTMLGLATTRRFAYHSLGALGVIELTAPQRAAKVASGMKRLGIEPRIRAYFDLHAVLDVLHAQCWIREIIRPLVTSNRECLEFIAEGALMRLHCGYLCFERYSSEFGLNFAGNSHSQLLQFSNVNKRAAEGLRC